MEIDYNEYLTREEYRKLKINIKMIGSHYSKRELIGFICELWQHGYITARQMYELYGMVDPREENRDDIVCFFELEDIKNPFMKYLDKLIERRERELVDEE